MEKLSKRWRLGLGAVVLAALALSAAPAGAYCNLEPCNDGQRRTCSFCTYVDEFEGGHCRYTLFYCVDCGTGEFFHWEESQDYCLYEPF